MNVPEPSPRGFALHWQILIGLVIGAAGGLLAQALYPPGADGKPHEWIAWTVYYIAEPVGQIFLRLIFMVVLPLLFCALVLGVTGIGDVRGLGRMGLKTLALTVVLSTTSVFVGIAAVNLVRPGAHLPEAQRAVLRERFETEAKKQAADVKQTKSTRDALLDIIPRNLLREMVGAADNSSPGGGMLAVMFFAVAFGIALLFVGPPAAVFLNALEGAYAALMAIIGFAMRLAPLGVAGLMFKLTAELGEDVLKILLWYVVTVVGALALHLFGVYSLVLALLARINPLRFFGQTSEAMLTAFATSSSNATLPTALRVAEERLGLRRTVRNFVLTVGSTANQNGTALYEGIAILFLAQVFGVDLTLGEQCKVAFLCILAGIGTAGVPGGSLPFIALVLQSVHVPIEGIGLIIGVDRLLDMCRTTLNVTGDLAVAACVDRWEPPASDARPAQT